LDAGLAEVDRRSSVLEQQRKAYDVIAMIRFEDVDVAGCDRLIADLEERRTTILQADDQLQVLQRQMEELTERLEVARKQRFGLEERQRLLNDAHAELVDSEDLVIDRVEAMEGAGTVHLDEEQEAALAAEFAEAAAPAD